MGDPRGEVTRLLQAGDTDAVLALVYDELRSIAVRHMARERAGHILQPTALVHEAFMRLFAQDGASWTERRHFYATAAEAMRRLLVEYARRARAAKRGGDTARVTLGAADIPVELDLEQVVALDDALEVLAREDPQAAEVARLRFLVGLDVAETAAALAVSVRTVHRDWVFARARLFQLLGS
jgi:RNA polymerase sigma factor (TIGR02999 family)